MFRANKTTTKTSFKTVTETVNFENGPLASVSLKTAIAEAANAANANARSGVGPSAPLDAAAEAVMALVEASAPARGGGPEAAGGATSATTRAKKMSALGASRFGSRGATATPATPATPATLPVADGYGSDGSDAGRSTYSAAPSRRGDGDSDEEEERDARDSKNAARARRRGNRGANASSYVWDADIDLDDVL